MDVVKSEQVKVLTIESNVMMIVMIMVVVVVVVVVTTTTTKILGTTPSPRNRNTRISKLFAFQ